MSRPRQYGELAEIAKPELQARGLQVFEISTKSGTGLQGLIFAMAEIVRERRASAPPPSPPPPVTGCCRCVGSGPNPTR